MAGTNKKGMYAEFEWGTYRSLEGAIARDGIVDGKELAEALRRHRGEPIPDKVFDYLCARLEGTDKKRGRKPDKFTAHVRTILVPVFYERYFTWFQRRKRQCGLKGWPRIRDADWWQGPPHERAARMVAKRLFPNHTWRHVANFVSSQKRQRICSE